MLGEKKYSVGIFRSAVLSSSFLIVTRLAQRLPVTPVPEQRPVTTVRFDVIHIGRPDVPAFFHALHTQWVCFRVLLPCFLPCPSVTAGFGASHFLGVHRFVGIAVFGPVWYKRRTAGMPAWCVRS
jgi:hypothetical protein